MVEDKKSPFHARASDLPKYDVAVAMAQVELLYADEMKREGQYEEWSKLKDVYKKQKWAIDHGYAEFYSNDKVKSVAHAKVPDNQFKVTDAEANSIYKSMMNLEGDIADEDIYVALYQKYIGSLANHLANEMIRQAKERAKEGTALYDLDVLQQMLGENLEGLNYLGAGTYSIKGTTTNENNVINHKIFLDINNNDKLDVGEQVLYDYNTNRESDTVNHIVLSIDESGKTTVMATPASEYD
jgi:hypothetical protein